MVLGYFGRTPVPPDAEIVKIAEQQLGKPVFKGDPLDVLEPGIPKATKILQDEGLPVTDENIFIVGALATAGGNKGLDFLKGHKPINVRKVTESGGPEKKPVAQQAQAPITVGPQQYKVTVDGQTYDVMVADDTGAVTAVTPTAAKEKEATPVNAQIPGNVYEVFCAVGDKVKAGDTLVILEAMKMETPVAAPVDGTIATLEVQKGQTVKAGQLIATLA
jgi:pyruvate carboxylase subunit B